MAELTHKELELLNLIGKGDYDYALPDDDETVDALQSLIRSGFLTVDPCGIGDYISPTGKRHR